MGSGGRRSRTGCGPATARRGAAAGVVGDAGGCGLAAGVGAALRGGVLRGLSVRVLVRGATSGAPVRRDVRVPGALVFGPGGAGGRVPEGDAAAEPPLEDGAPAGGGLRADQRAALGGSRRG